MDKGDLVRPQSLFCVPDKITLHHKNSAWGASREGPIRDGRMRTAPQVNFETGGAGLAERKERIVPD